MPTLINPKIYTNRSLQPPVVDVWAIWRVLGGLGKAWGLRVRQLSGIANDSNGSVETVRPHCCFFGTAQLPRKSCHFNLRLNHGPLSMGP